MSIRNIRGRDVTHTVSLLPQNPYRWRGTPGWDPAASLAQQAVAHTVPNLSHAGKVARFARFGQLRQSGLTVREAAQKIGVGERTGREYEKERAGGGAG